MSHIIVIGTDTKKGKSPLAMVLSAISRAMKKRTRIFVSTPTGTWESDADKADRKIPTANCARRMLCDEGGAIPRLLLFDAVSRDKKLEPSAGLLVWLEYYLSMCMDTVSVSTGPTWISLEEVITEFLSNKEKNLCWTGLTKPDKYGIEYLAKNRWGEVMKRLSHDQRNSWRNAQ